VAESLTMEKTISSLEQIGNHINQGQGQMLIK